MAEIADRMAKCIQCGACEKVCPSFRFGGCDPKEVMAGKPGNVTKCVQCGACSRVCKNTDPVTVMLYMKAKAVGSSIPMVYRETGFVRPVSDVSRSELRPVWKDGGQYLMSGCIVESFAPFLIYAGTVAIEVVGEGCTELPKNTCCTYPLPFRTMTFAERDAIKKDMGDSASGKPIVALCPGCEAELRRSDVNATHIVNFLADRKDKLPKFHKKIKVAIEPGCHYSDLLDDMIAVTKALGAEYVDNDFGCCGKAVQGITEPLMEEREAEVEGADVLLVACPMCFTRYDAYPNGVPVMHVAELVAAAAGDTRTLAYHKLRPAVF